MGRNLSHRHFDVSSRADIRRVRYWTDENESIVECHRDSLSPAFSDTDIFPLGLVCQADLDNISKQGNLRMPAMVDNPFDAELFIVALNEYFAQFTQEAGVAGTAIAETEA